VESTILSEYGIKPKRLVKYIRDHLDPNLLLLQAYYYDFINTIVVWGPKRHGKSAWAIKKARYMHGSWDKAFEHLCFTVDEFLEIYEKYRMKIEGILNRDDLSPDEIYKMRVLGRCKCLVWDDVSAYFHASTVNYWDMTVAEAINKFVLAGQYIANLIITTDDIDKMPENLWREVEFQVYAFERGRALVLKKAKMPKFKGQARAYIKTYPMWIIYWRDVRPEIRIAYERIRDKHSSMLKELAHLKSIMKEDETEVEDHVEPYTGEYKDGVMIKDIDDLKTKLEDLLAEIEKQ